MTSSPAIGQPVSRVEGAAKVTGAARYAAEIHVPGLHIALLLGSRVPHGRVTHIDTAAAEAIPGVVGVLTHRNMPRLGTDIQTFPLGTAGTKQLPLQNDEILHEGQYVACVVAKTIEAAGRALGALRVEYDELPPVTFAGCLAANTPPQEIGSLPDVRVDAQQEKPDAHGPNAGDLAPHELPEFLAKGMNTVREDPDAGLAAAEVTAGGVFDTPSIYQSPIEIGATIAVPQAGDRLTVYDSTQHILGVRNALSRVLEMPLENIRVVAHYVGGGFGAKCFTWPHTICARPLERLVSTVNFGRGGGCWSAGHLAQRLGFLSPSTLPPQMALIHSTNWPRSPASAHKCLSLAKRAAAASKRGLAPSRSAMAALCTCAPSTRSELSTSKWRLPAWIFLPPSYNPAPRPGPWSWYSGYR